MGYIQRNKIWLIGIIAAIGILANTWMVGTVQAQALDQSTSDQVDIYMFWGDGCPHCAKAKPYFEGLAKDNPQIVLHFFEVWNDKSNRDYFITFSQSHGFEPTGVPTIFIGDQYWVGFNDQIQTEIGEAVKKCFIDTCQDPALIVGARQDQVQPEPVPTPNPVLPGNSAITVPLLGSINLEHQSLFVSTLLIALVDGVNPCSIWVLTMLLALTLHTGSRKKIVIIGLIFITVTALIYALFILGLFSIMSVLPFRGIIQVIVAIIAVIFGIINIKDYFWYKEGISLTIADENKPGLYRKMRKAVDAKDSFWGLAGATVVLAAGVSLVEFSCTAGFPVLWTNLIHSQQVPWITFAILLLLYMVIYQLDELIIFFTAVFTLKATKLEEKEGRILKLIGGVLMFTLASVMLIKPEWMSNLTGSLYVFGIAFGAIILILVLHRILLPRMGIRIGSEKQKPMSKRPK